MTGPNKRLADLARIAAVLAERGLAPVAQAQGRLVAQRAQIEELAARRARLSLDGADPVVAARLARLAERLRHDQAAAMADLACAQAEFDMAKQAARPAVARKSVLERLVHQTRQGR